MKDLLTRTVSGVMIVFAVLASVLLADYTMLVLVLAIFSLGITEFRKIFRLKTPGLFILVLLGGQLILIFGFLSFTGLLDHVYMIMGPGIILTLILLFYLLSKSNMARESGLYLLALIWIAGSLLLFMALGWESEPEGYSPLLPIMLISMIWIYDTGAYLFGSLLGKTPLSSAISPGKTWEGCVSGILLTVVAGYLVFLITDLYDPVAWFIISFVISLGATAGDLFESKLKRDAGVKDSGQLIPGHGGILDRFDSLFFSAPLFYMFLQIYQRL